MQTFATLAMAGIAAAAPHANHAAFHEKKGLFDGLENMAAGLTGDLSSLMTNANSVLAKVGAKQALNSQDPTETSWVGEAQSGNAVVNTIVNQGHKDTTFTCWGNQGSWINAIAPTVSVLVPAGKNVTISHAIGQDGATNTGGCSPIDEDTELLNGQIFNSWLEYNWLNSMWGSSTFDVSMEVNPSGRNMSVVGPKCTSDLNRCSFHCNDASVKQCGEAGTYFLKNCEAGSQEAASAGQWGGQASGGCMGIANTGISKITTYLH